MNCFKRTKKLTVSLIIILCFAIVTECSSKANDKQTTKNDNIEVIQETEKSEDKISENLSYIFDIIYTNEYNLISDLQPESLNQYDIDKFENAKEYFTESSFVDIVGKHFYISNIFHISNLECDTSIDSIEIDVRETGDNERVCYIAMDIKLDYADVSKDIEFLDLNAIATVIKVNDEWKIDNIQVNKYTFRNKRYN